MALLGAAGLDALGRPLAVEVFVHKTRRIMVGSVKAVKRGEVAKRQRQLALLRPHTGLLQALERPGAAQLVAVN